MAIRLPPASFLLSDARFDREEADDYGSRIAAGKRKFYPELSHWHDSALVEALGEYGENVEWCADFSRVWGLERQTESGMVGDRKIGDSHG